MKKDSSGTREVNRGLIDCRMDARKSSFQISFTKREVMKKLLIIAFSVVALVLPVAAQNKFSRAEIFGGYQFTHLEPSLDANGWSAAVSGNLSQWFGLTADFSGAYKDGGHIYTYMVGPTFSARTERVTAFAHALLGGASSGSDSAFSMAMGGGIDVNPGDHFSIRLIQADWLLFRSGGFTDRKNARVSAGIVLRF
jgi:opacity protein-like surface antigen